MISGLWRNRLFAAAAVIASVVLGVKVAQGEFMWPALIGGGLAAIALTRTLPFRLTTFLLGLALLGYIVGNRGFAQISVTGNLPILPAEFVLMIGGPILVFSSAVRRRVPAQRDALNLCLAVWMILSSIRFIPDLNTFGVMALRDFATVYYAAFFFLAQEAGSSERDRGFLLRMLSVGFVALMLIYPVYAVDPDFFMDHFLVRGVPLIYYKGDLLGTFLAAGSILAFARFEKTGSKTDFVLSLVMAAETMTTNNRASMLGLLIPACLLAFGRRPRFLLTLSGCGVAAILAIVFWAEVRGQSWVDTPVHEMYERAISLTDPNGQNSYSGEDTSNKGDNNVFRSTWWRIVLDETIQASPWVGLGWGADLAEEFVKVYYPEGGEDFNVRSPHNVFVTTFARTGVVGLIPFIAVACAIAAGAWRAVRRDSDGMGLWLVACAILISSTFGVVLEGPMGAVLFWTVLGLANSSVLASAAPPAAGTESPVAMAGAAGTQSPR